MRKTLWVAISVGVGGAAFAETSPTFSKDVAPILYKNCASCHRPGDIAPMPLLSYEQARPWAKSIREKVSLGQMPPWHAAQPAGTFSNDRRLTEADKDILVRWAAAGAPQGNPKDLPPAPKFTEGWEIGTPDAVFSIPKAYDVSASGTIAYQYFTVPTNFTEDKWVQAIEVRPGNRAVVHHVLVFSREQRTPGRTPAYTAVLPKPIALAPNANNSAAHSDPPAPQKDPDILIATTAPGTNAMIFEPGSAMRIKAGSTLVFQIHYTANGKPATDQSSVGMIFSRDAPAREVRNGAFTNVFLKLPAGASDQSVDSVIQFNQNIHITALFPHTHVRGKSWEYRLVYPNGNSEIVLSVPKYDFNWQTYYVYSKPLAVPKGALLEARARYDNSDANPSNPDPKIEVHWGEQTWQEMQYSGITYYVDDAPGAPAAPSSPAEQK
jgi:hypothetical protein